MKNLIQLFRSKSPSQKNLSKKLRKIIGFTPAKIELFEQALQHKSVSPKFNNERLEFLGDSVLGMVVANFLYSNFSKKDEGFLTQMRTKIVNNDQLNTFAVQIGIDKLIKANLHKNEIYFSITAKTLEALIGAIYLDKGFKAAQTFIVNKLLNEHIRMDELRERVISFKSKLVEYVQKEKVTLRFELLEERVEKKEKIYKVQVFVDNCPMAIAENYSKKRAEEMAAEETYKTLFNPENSL